MTNHNNGKTKLGLVSLIINDKEYKVPVNITISDDEIYFKCLVNSNSYVQALSEMIHNKLKKLFTAESDVPSTETIAAEGEKLFPAFINGVLSENTRIKELYNGISDVEDMMERFGIALEQNREEQIQKILNVQHFFH